MPHNASPPAPSRALHVAIIMDGNGRWATARGLPRVAGHRQGAEAVRRTVEAAPALHVGTLTLYAFSSDNWQRPPREVALLMRLFGTHLRTELPALRRNGVRLSVIGRRDRLAPSLVRQIELAERATAGGTRLHLRLAIDYSSRDALVRAAARLRDAARPRDGGDSSGAAGALRLEAEASRVAADASRGATDASRVAADEGRVGAVGLLVETGDGAHCPADLSRDALRRALGAAYGEQATAPDVDLLVRTGGEQRLSDFLLWESAYAELLFLPCMWPEFDGDTLGSAVAEFHGRERRFGTVPSSVAS